MATVKKKRIVNVPEKNFRWDMAVGQAMRDLRETQEVSIEDMAAHVGVQRSLISQWELGAAALPMKRLLPICDGLGTFPHLLLKMAWDLYEPENKAKKKAKKKAK